MSLQKFKTFLGSNIRFISITLINTLCLSVFLFLLRNVKAPGKIVETDISFFLFMKGLRNDAVTHALKLVTTMASTSTITLGLIVGSVYFYKTRHWNTLIAFIISVGGGSLFVAITKLLIQRTRPSLLEALVEENTFSFPSGHVFMAICFYGFWAYYFIQSSDKRGLKNLIFFATAFLVIAIATSRTYLGAHWLSDVVASMAAGSAWLLSIVGMLEIRKKNKI